MAQKTLPAQLTKRTPLQDIIPLETPYSVLLSPMDYCNIKCIFCPFHGEVRGDNRSPEIMSFELFKMIIDQLSEFPQKVKTLIFCGRGEPTLHKDLPDMIAYAKEKNVAEAIRLTTNGFNLSPELNLRLIEAGLDYIRISVPAMDAETCFELTGAELDLDKYIGNIKHLYDHKHANMTVFCKTTNVALGAKNGAAMNQELAKKFYTAFDDCCDYCFVENIVPQVPHKMTEEEKAKMWIGNTETKNVYVVENEGCPVCERLFYHFTINSSGNVFPCDLNENENLRLGNVKEKSLTQIWNGETLHKIRLAFLNGDIPKACEDCSVFVFDFPNELHKHADTICERLIKRRESEE